MFLWSFYNHIFVPLFSLICLSLFLILFLIYFHSSGPCFGNVVVELLICMLKKQKRFFVFFLCVVWPAAMRVKYSVFPAAALSCDGAVAPTRRLIQSPLPPSARVTARPRWWARRGRDAGGRGWRRRWRRWRRKNWGSVEPGCKIR